MGPLESTWVVLMASSPALVLGLMFLFRRRVTRLKRVAGDLRALAARLSDSQHPTQSP